MITIDDRLHDAGDDLRHAATRIPDRGRPTRRRSVPVPVGVRWVATALAVAALVALPIWLGATGTPPQTPPAGDGSESDRPDASLSLGPFGLDDAHIILDLAEGVGAEEAERLMTELRQRPEVDEVLLVTREQAVSEWSAHRSEAFGDDKANLDAAVAGVTASIRLLVHDGTDRLTLGQALADDYLDQHDRVDTTPVRRITVNVP
jgi:hypothetical protein